MQMLKIIDPLAQFAINKHDWSSPVDIMLH